MSISGALFKARRRRRKRPATPPPAVLLIPLIAGAAAWRWWQHDATPDQRLAVYATLTVIVLLLTMLLLKRWLAKRAVRRRYLAALVEFRWRPDMTPLEFETCCADYLHGRGWNTKLTQVSGDQGIDVLARKSGKLVVLQCKLHSRPVGNKAVQEALAGKTYASAHFAAVVSNQGYTKAAQDLSKKTGVFLLHFTELAKADELFS
jgi:HJR/Mrr/RecB family endonuclease